MKHLILTTAIAVTPAMALSQTQEEVDKGYLTTLIEDSLSGATRDVNIVGFEGALSSAASLDLLTISDADGVWLTLEDVVLDWNRSALLRGRIDVSSLSAARIIVARPPISEAQAPSPEASAFALPELPVGITLGALAIEELTLGAPFLGEEISLTISGDAALSNGEGSANLLAERLSEKVGRFALNGDYSNESRILGLNLDVQEDAGGIAATLMELHGRPSVGLVVNGTAPIDTYAADIAIATDGQDRIAGTFGLTRDAIGQRIALDIGGDVTLLFAPEYRAFFGDNVSLEVLARTGLGSAFDLENLNLQSKALTLSGTAKVGPDGWPQQISLRGQIANEDGSVVLLPLTGPKTYVDRASFNLGFDETVGPDWSTETTMIGFERPGLRLGELQFAGVGEITSGTGDATGQITADFQYGATGLVLDDIGAADAFGDALSGQLQISRTEGEPTQITRLTLDGPGIEVVADASISGASKGLRTQSNMVLTVDALDRFSTLAGRDLAGAGDFTISSTIVPLEGLFDVLLTGATSDLSLGIDQIDNVLAGKGSVNAFAKRDNDGTRLETLQILTDAASLTASADLQSDGSTAQFSFETTDVALIEPQITGAAAVTGSVTQSAEGVIDVAVKGTAPATTFDIAAQSNPSQINGQITAMVSDLSTYAGITGQDLSGAAGITANGVLLGDGQRFVADVAMNTQDIATGITKIDPLLRGDGTLTAEIARTGADRFRLRDAMFTTPQTTITATVEGGYEGEGFANITADIADAAVLGQGLSGPVSLNADATRDAANVGQVDLTVTGPGTDIAVDADITADGLTNGTARADIANLATYRSLIGQPVGGAVSARLSGQVASDLSQFDARFSGTTRDLRIGNAVADTLLRGNGTANATMALNDGQLTINDLAVSTANIKVSGSLGGQSGTGRGTFEARLRDVGVLTDQLSGPATATGTAALTQTGDWTIAVQGSGPGGMTLQSSGQLRSSGILDLTATGRAPLGLANQILEPRRVSGDAVFNLSINGQPGLDAVSARVTLADASLTAPTLAQGLSDITGGVSLSNGSAQIDVTGTVQTGGTVTVTGPVALSAPNRADIVASLNDVIIKDPELYKTSVSGQVSITGPLQGGARIGGVLTLGQTDVQVPSSGVGALGDLPDVTHIGEIGAVRNTLSRAGISSAPSNTVTSGGPAFPLDLTINAPSRIFVRGRGVDAELGGSLRIARTTQNIQPVGLFELVRGRIDILQQRFELTEGSASLQGDFDPYIRLVATTEARTGTTISIVVEGPATAPEVSFTSVPQLPQDEVLAQLIFGRDLQNISPLQAVQLAAAVGTLAGRGGGGLIDTFRQNVGLDDFDITTDDDGNAAVRAGKYLSENIYTDVTVSSDGSTEINLNLDITDEITAKGTVDADGETSIGIFFERDY